MTMEQKCTCNGGNPNCYKCGGWGYVKVETKWAHGQYLREVRSSLGGPSGIVSNTPKRPRKRKNRTTPCPFCKKMLSGIPGLISHVKHCHYSQIEEFRDSDIVKKYCISRSVRICHVCNTFVKDLDGHLRWKHPTVVPADDGLKSKIQQQEAEKSNLQKSVANLRSLVVTIESYLQDVENDKMSVEEMSKRRASIDDFSSHLDDFLKKKLPGY